MTYSAQRAIFTEWLLNDDGQFPPLSDWVEPDGVSDVRDRLEVNQSKSRRAATSRLLILADNMVPHGDTRYSPAQLAIFGGRVRKWDKELEDAQLRASKEPHMTTDDQAVVDRVTKELVVEIRVSETRQQCVRTWMRAGELSLLWWNGRRRLTDSSLVVRPCDSWLTIKSSQSTTNTGFI